MTNVAWASSPWTPVFRRIAAADSKSEAISLSQLEGRSALAYSIGVPIDIASTQFMGKMPMLLNKLINPSKPQHLM